MSLSRRDIWLMAGLLTVGCLSPTLPLPPPTRPTIYGPDASGNVTLVGSEQPHVAVIAENLNTGQIRGQRTESSGRYEIVIPAQIGDEMVTYYMKLLEMSDSRYFRIPEPPPPILGNGGAGSGGMDSGESGAGGGTAGSHE